MKDDYEIYSGMQNGKLLLAFEILRSIFKDYGKGSEIEKTEILSWVESEVFLDDFCLWAHCLGWKQTSLLQSKLVVYLKTGKTK